MADTEQLPRSISEAVALVEAVRDLSRLATGDARYGIEKMIEYRQGLFERSPLKVGDACRPRKGYRVGEDSWGWKSAAHMLEHERDAVVREIDYRKGHFIYAVEFVEETWVSTIDGKEHPSDPDRKHLYWMWEDDLG